MPPATNGGFVQAKAEPDKTSKVSVSFPKTLLAQAKRERAPRKGQFSEYLQKLVALDLKNEAVGTTREDIMDFLTDKLCGERYAFKLRPLLSGLDQRDELARVLKLYVDSGGLPEQNVKRFGRVPLT